MIDFIHPFDPDSLEIEINHVASDFKEIEITYGMELKEDFNFTSIDQTVMLEELKPAITAAIKNAIRLINLDNNTHD